MSNAPILLVGAATTVLEITDAAGGLAGLKLISQSGPAVTVEQDSGFGWEPAGLPMLLFAGTKLRLTRTVSGDTVTVLQAIYPEISDPNGNAAALSSGSGIGAQRPPPYTAPMTLVAVRSVGILYMGRGIGLRGLSFTRPVDRSKIESIEVRDYDNNNAFSSVDTSTIAQNGLNELSFPPIGLERRQRLNINFTEPVSLDTLAAPDLTPDTTVIATDANYSQISNTPLVLTRGLLRRVYGPLSVDALPVSADPVELYAEHTGHLLAEPGQIPRLRFIHEGVTYTLAMAAEEETS